MLLGWFSPADALHCIPDILSIQLRIWKMSAQTLIKCIWIRSFGTTRRWCSSFESSYDWHCTEVHKGRCNPKRNVHRAWCASILIWTPIMQGNFCAANADTQCYSIYASWLFWFAWRYTDRFISKCFESEDQVTGGGGHNWWFQAIIADHLTNLEFGEDGYPMHQPEGSTYVWAE